MAKKRKAKLRVDRVLICAAILIALVVGIVMLVRALTKRHSSVPPAPTTPSETVDVSQVHPEGEYLEIEQDDCTLIVGSILMLTCKSNPEDLANQVTWSTTNAQILTVDSKGRMEVVGTGTAAVVAVAGTYTDSIIVEAVADEDVNPENPTEPTADSSNPNEEQPTKPSEEGDSQPSTQPSASQSNPSQAASTTQVVQESTPAPTAPSSSDEQPGGASSEVEPGAEVEPSQPDAGDEETEMDYPVMLAYTAEEAGFTPYYGGAYEYREDGNYLGVAIITDSMTQIYLKTRTTSFDRSIKTLLAAALPHSYETAFAQLLGAKETVTLRLDGLKVRIIVPSEGNSEHKQLILYYE